MALSGRLLPAPVVRRPGAAPSQQPGSMASRRGDRPVEGKSFTALRATGGSGRTDGWGRSDGLGRQREGVVDVQRARMLSAMTNVAAERGAGNVTVACVVERAGVSRRTFYELFCDVDECLLAAIDDGVECARRRVGAAYDPGAPWRVRVRAGLVALLGLFDEQPALARLLLVESLAGGPAALALRARALQPLIAVVEEGRFQSKHATSVPALAGESVVGGVCSLVSTRIVQGTDRPLTSLASELTSMIVLPYLGLAAARRELKAPLPAPTGVSDPQSEPALLSDPFKAAGMRLTYRTIRVLSAIASEPGASNRRIGNAAEIGDQGQTSKLLARLQRLGLIVNSSLGHAKGDANAWTLTPVGQQVVGNIRTHMGTPGAQHTGTSETQRTSAGPPTSTRREQ
jgi:AcrR family transcriptional regulator